MSALGRIFSGPEGVYAVAVVGGVGDAAARERYRAWLAGRGDERAAAIARAQEILAKSAFVRERWSAVTRSAPVRNCGRGPSAPRPVRFSYECPRTWEALDPTADPTARHCDSCARLVYLCRSAREAEERARRGECVTIPNASWSEVARDMTSSYTGRPDPIAIWADRVFPGEPTDE